MIKTIALSLAGLAFCCQNINAQFWENEEIKPPSILKKGDVLITGFVSYPNFGRFTAQLALSNVNVLKSSTGGFAPLGVQGEYMLSQNMGISLDLIANQWSAKWTESNAAFENSVASFRFRGLIGLNYHLDDLDNEKLNIYGGMALGYNYRKYDITLDEYGLVDDFWQTNIDFPLAFRARAGLRYFLNENVGLNVEIGLGGPIMRLGLTGRIPNPADRATSINKM